MSFSPTISESQLREYKISRGTNRAKPNTGCRLIKSKDVMAMEVLVRVPEKSLFDYEGDLDMKDQSKLFGFHMHLYNNVKDNLIFTFNQSNFKDKEYKFHSYLNSDSDFSIGAEVTGKAGELVHAYFRRRLRNGKVWDCYLKNLNTGQTSSATHETRVSGIKFLWWEFLRTMRGPWYGGANNAEGPYGDHAPKDIYVYMHGVYHRH
jgi:hypothetical protein